MISQIFDKDGKQRTSENMERPERDSLHLARITGALLLFATIGGIAFFFLGALFGTWGDPNAEDHAVVAFAAYHQHPLLIPLSYYGLMVDGLLFIALAPLLYLNGTRSQAPFKLLAAIFQAQAGLIQALAASRWVIVLPLLAQTYANPQTSAATRTALDVTYQAISSIFGLTLGEHFYFLFTGSWSFFLAISLLRSSDEKRWLGWLGVVAGALLLLASFEQLPFSFGDILLIFLVGGNLTWLVWAVSLATTLLTTSVKPTNCATSLLKS